MTPIKSILNQIQQNNEIYKSTDEFEEGNKNVKQCKRFLVEILKTDFYDTQRWEMLKIDIWEFLKNLNK